MKLILLKIPAAIKSALWRHLLPRRLIAEEAAFAFARWESEPQDQVLRCLEWLPVSQRGFASRSRFHFELSDRTRGFVIKRAHDLGASLVEFHSHDGDWPAAFSVSDLSGLEEFVPHVWWRLKGRPYAAVVVARSSHDGLVWLGDPQTAVHLDGIIVNGKLGQCTRRSELRFEEHGRRPF
jgi:hypothetical protein